MSISPTSSAVNLITAAQHKSADAAKDITASPVQKHEVGSAEYNAVDIIKPVLSLKEAELETSAAVQLLDADKAQLGSLLDILA